MQNVIVAGGAGFIGSHLCRSLLKDGYKVICIDNLLTGDRANVVQLEGNPSFHFLEHDVIDTLPPLPVDSVDYVFHLASPASPNKKSEKSYIRFPLETLLANSQGTHTLLEFANKNNASFLFTSTSEIYGDPLVSPQREDYFGNVNPIGVRSVYDEAKRFGESITMAYVRTFGLDARIIRVFNTYGPFMQKDDGRVVSNFITQAIMNKPITIFGDGTQTRSFCYVDDMAEGIKKAMFSENTKGEVINLGNPEERTISELATMIKKQTESDSEITYEELPEDDPKQRKPDIEKAKKILHWSPEVSITDGLQKTIDYFKSI